MSPAPSELLNSCRLNCTNFVGQIRHLTWLPTAPLQGAVKAGLGKRQHPATHTPREERVTSLEMWPPQQRLEGGWGLPKSLLAWWRVPGVVGGRNSLWGMCVENHILLTLLPWACVQIAELMLSAKELTGVGKGTLHCAQCQLSITSPGSGEDRSFCPPGDPSSFQWSCPAPSWLSVLVQRHSESKDRWWILSYSLPSPPPASCL